MPQDSDRELIEKLISETISENELAQLRQRAQESPEIAQQVEERLRMISTLQYEDEQALRTAIRVTLDTAPTSTGHFQQYGRQYLAACITLLILALASFLLIKMLWQSPAEIAIATFTPFQAESVSGSDRSAGIGLKLYQQGAYEKALTQLQDRGNLQNPDNVYNLIIGSAHFQLRHWPAARFHFAPGTQSSDVVIQNEARWYEALTLVASENPLAISRLRNIATNPGPHQQEAIKLLKRLEE